MKISDYLAIQSGDTLKRWLSYLRVPTTGLTRKELMAEAVERQLTNSPASFAELLTETERLYLAECAHRGQVLSDEAFKAKYGRPVYAKVRDSWTPVDKSIRYYLEIVVGRLDRADVSVLVDEMIAPLKALLPAPVDTPVKSVASLPSTVGVTSRRWGGERPIHVYESEKVAPQELMRVLRLVQAGRLEVSDSSHRPTSGTVRTVTEILVVPDYALDEPPLVKSDDRVFLSEPDVPGPVRAHAWPVVIQQCGWAKRRGKSLRLTPEGEAIMAGMDPRKLSDGVHRLKWDDVFDELSRIPAIRGQSGNARRFLTPPGDRRCPVVEALGNLPANSWIQFSELVRHMRAMGFTWPVGADGLLYFGEALYGGIHDVVGLENQYLRAFLMETLATLGLLDIAYTFPAGVFPEFRGRWGMDSLSYISRYDGLQFVRITPLGAYVLAPSDRKPAYDGPTSEAIYTLNPANEFVPVRAEMEVSTRAFLEQFATPTDGGRWRLDEVRVLNHLAAGVSTQTILSWIKTGLAADLPEGFADFVEGLNVRREACRGMEDAVIIRWSSADLVHVILNYPEVGKLAQAYGRTAIVAPRKSLTALRKALLAQGFVLPVE